MLKPETFSFILILKITRTILATRRTDHREQEWGYRHQDYITIQELTSYINIHFLKIHILRLCLCYLTCLRQRLRIITDGAS